MDIHVPHYANPFGYAVKNGIPLFSESRMTEKDTNANIGIACLRRKVAFFRVL